MNEAPSISRISIGNIKSTLAGLKPACEEPLDEDACEAAILILQELEREGITDLEGVRDLIEDYNAQARTYQAMHRKFDVASKPIRKDGVLHCPECNHRVSPHHSHCHWCGKKLGY